MWLAESRRDAENRVYDSASEFAFVAQRLQMELSRPEAARVLAPVLGCIDEALTSVAGGLRAVAAAGDPRGRGTPDLERSLEACAMSIEAAAQRCERARRAAARRQHPCPHDQESV